MKKIIDKFFKKKLKYSLPGIARQDNNCSTEVLINSAAFEVAVTDKDGNILGKPRLTIGTDLRNLTLWSNDITIRGIFWYQLFEKGMRGGNNANQNTLQIPDKFIVDDCIDLDDDLQQNLKQIPNCRVVFAPKKSPVFVKVVNGISKDIKKIKAKELKLGSKKQLLTLKQFEDIVSKNLNDNQVLMLLNIINDSAESSSESETKPLFNVSTGDIEKVLFGLLPSVFRKIGKRGVTLHNIVYSSKQKILPEVGTICQIRWNPRDLTYCYCCYGGEVITLEAILPRKERLNDMNICRWRNRLSEYKYDEAWAIIHKGKN